MILIWWTGSLSDGADEERGLLGKSGSERSYGCSCVSREERLEEQVEEEADREEDNEECCEELDQSWIRMQLLSSIRGMKEGSAR